MILAAPVTIALLAINVMVFSIQCYLEGAMQLNRFLGRGFGVHLPAALIPGWRWSDWFGHTFALSLDGLRTGHFWQLLTFQFMHGGVLHILLNSWAIFVFGPVVEYTLGRARMLGLYLVSGVVGGFLQVAGVLVWPRLFDYGPVVGASAGVFGLMAAFAVFYPREKLYLLLFFVIPLALKARTFLMLLALISVAGILYPLWQPLLSGHSSFTLQLDRLIDPLFANVGHAAHLGGLFAGLAGAIAFKRRRLPTPIPPHAQPASQ